MRLKRVDYNLIRPNPNNPRQDFDEGKLQELADSFSFTPDRPGEPFTPPIVVADGDAYLLVDGERRWRAMGITGVMSCLVNIAEDMDEANAVAAALATDSKESLKDAERARGVQQMLLLGGSELAAEKLGHLQRGQAGRISRVIAQHGGALQTSMDDLLAVAEIDDAARREHLLELLDADMASPGPANTSAFRRQARIYRNLQQAEHKFGELADAISPLLGKGHAFTMCGERPGEGWRLAATCITGEAVEAAVERLDAEYPDGWLLHLVDAPEAPDKWGIVQMPYARCYVPDVESAEDAEAREQRERREAEKTRLVAALKAIMEAHLRFICGACASGEVSLDAFKDLRDAAEEELRSHYMSDAAVIDALDAECPGWFTSAGLAAVLPFIFDELEPLCGHCSMFGSYLADGECPGSWLRRARKVTDFAALLGGCGYEPGDTEEAIMAEMRGWLAEGQ